MERAIQFPARVLSRDAPSEHESGLFSTESVLNLQKLIFAGSPLSEVLANIAQLVESQAEGTRRDTIIFLAHMTLTGCSSPKDGISNSPQLKKAPR